MAIYTTYDEDDDRQYSRYQQATPPPTDIQTADQMDTANMTYPSGDLRASRAHQWEYTADAQERAQQDSRIGNIQTAPGIQGAGSSTTPTVNQTGPPPPTVTDYAHNQAPASSGTPGPAQTDPNISPVTGMPRSQMSMNRAADHDRFMGELGSYIGGEGPFPRMGPRPTMPGQPAPAAPFPQGPMATDPATGLPMRDAAPDGGFSSPFRANGAMNAAGASPPPPTSIPQDAPAESEIDELEAQVRSAVSTGSGEEAEYIERIRAIDPERASRLEAFISSRGKKAKNAPTTSKSTK